MNLSTAFTELGAALGTITGLRVQTFPDASVSAPQVTIAFPDSIEFDETYGRGSDRLTLQAVVFTSMTDPRTGFTALLAYCAGSGSSSVKAAIEAGTYTQSADVRVTGIDFDIYAVGGVSYYAAVFTIDVYGNGS